MHPCPWVSCKYHLYLEVTPRGSLKLNFPHLEPDELVATCALDVADMGGVVQEVVAGLTNITRQRIQQVEVAAVRQVRIALLPKPPPA